MATTFVFGEYELDESLFELRRNGARVDAQPKVLKLLFYLIAHRSRAVGTGELLDELWPNETVTPASVKRAVRGARRALQERDEHGSLSTVRGRGYRFMREVREVREVSSRAPRRATSSLPKHVLPRRALADELVALAARDVEHALLLRGSLTRVQDYLEIGDLTRVDQAICDVSLLAQRPNEPFFAWYAALCAAMRATIDARFADAEQLALTARDLGACVGGAAEQACSIQRVWIWMQQGRYAEAEALVTIIVGRQPEVLAWQTALACIQTLLGRPERARHALEQLLRETPGAARFDAFPLSAFAPATELCARTGDEETAAVLYRALSPWADRHAVVSVGMATHGPLARHLGMLAACLGELDAADAHFERATASTTQDTPMPALACMTALEHARTLALRKRRGDRERARALSTRALGAARAFGMQGVISGCHALRSDL